MKKGGTKRIVALLLALAMVFGLNTAAFAEEEPNESVTVILRAVDSNGKLLDMETMEKLGDIYEDGIGADIMCMDEEYIELQNVTLFNLFKYYDGHVDIKPERTWNKGFFVPANGRERNYTVVPFYEYDVSGAEMDMLVQPSPVFQLSKGHPKTVTITFQMRDYSSANSGSWIQSGSRWWYRYSDGSYPHATWEWIDENWYYFDASGWMQTGWINLGGTWYYLNGDGAMATGWLQIGGAWYYLDSDGAMMTGWQMIGDAWYYLTKNGAMATGWLNLGGTWYYLAGSGAMATGWVSDGGAWYYLNGDGAMATGWVQIGGTWYYLAGSGAMATGWIDLGGTWYYLNSDGAMAADTWIGSYYVNADGAWVA